MFRISQSLSIVRVMSLGKERKNKFLFSQDERNWGTSVVWNRKKIWHVFLKKIHKNNGANNSGPSSSFQIAPLAFLFFSFSYIPGLLGRTDPNTKWRNGGHLERYPRMCVCVFFFGLTDYWLSDSILAGFADTSYIIPVLFSVFFLLLPLGFWRQWRRVSISSRLTSKNNSQKNFADNQIALVMKKNLFFCFLVVVVVVSFYFLVRW